MVDSRECLGCKTSLEGEHRARKRCPECVKAFKTIRVRKWRKSPRGRKSVKKYLQSDKGKATKSRYMRAHPSGKHYASKIMWVLRRRQKWLEGQSEMAAWEDEEVEAGSHHWRSG